jgi:hypothetical protein
VGAREVPARSGRCPTRSASCRSSSSRSTAGSCPARSATPAASSSTCIGLLDRINLLTFLGLVVAFWMGFPLRGVIGDKILRDDDGKPLPPFEVAADTVFQLENPEAKLASSGGRPRQPEHLRRARAARDLTKTPAHYFPLETGLSNISADTIRRSRAACTRR